mmetsp:Transcript_57908/g.141491  ORF Transcript_57908/g.141491 Transcript_57908/m.141491 type:complete len:83 (-) Transcript_57908:1822-2070(-)
MNSKNHLYSYNIEINSFFENEDEDKGRPESSLLHFASMDGTSIYNHRSFYSFRSFVRTFFVCVCVLMSTKSSSNRSRTFSVV